jgi:hypothetical protein
MKVIIKEHSVNKPIYYSGGYGVAYCGDLSTIQKMEACSDDGQTRMEISLFSDGGFMFPPDCELEMEIVLKATPKKPETVTLILK